MVDRLVYYSKTEIMKKLILYISVIFFSIISYSQEVVRPYVAPDHAYVGFTDSTVTLAITQNTWAQITNANDTIFLIDHKVGVEYIGGDSLKIIRAGTYQVDGNLSFQGSNNEDWKIAVRRTRSGSTTTQGFPLLKYTSVANTVTVPFCSALFDCQTGDIVTLEIMNLTDDDDCVLKSCNFIIKFCHY